MLQAVGIDQFLAHKLPYNVFVQATGDLFCFGEAGKYYFANYVIISIVHAYFSSISTFYYIKLFSVKTCIFCSRTDNLLNISWESYLVANLFFRNH